MWFVHGFMAALGAKVAGCVFGIVAIIVIIIALSIIL